VRRFGRFVNAGTAPTPVEGHLPGFDGATGWLNSPPLTVSDLHGKVAVVNFCTYTCINWIRSLPYVRAWAERYRDLGLVTIGAHTPEFSFEHDTDNIRPALSAMRVEYPVAIDNDYAVWNAFANHYWPALYFVDAEGRIRHHRFGEGDYEESEMVIQRLLDEAGVDAVPDDPVSVEPVGSEAQADWPNLGSPETYLGESRSIGFDLIGHTKARELPATLALNRWAMSGDWTVRSEGIELNEAGGRIAIQFHARDVNLVMGPSTRDSSVRFRVVLDGVAPGEAAGEDVDRSGNGVLAEQRMHQLIRQPGPIVDRRFEIEFLDPGAEAFVFTFG
jgi:hypothetical protein